MGALSPVNELADRASLERVARGDMAALRRLYETHGARVLGFARRMLGDAQEAEEATQDVFVRTWQRAASYDCTRASPWAWLAMMTRSACLDRLRRRRRRPELAASAIEDAKLEPSCSTESEAGAGTDVPHLLDQLRPVERDCLAHVFFDGLSQTETAARPGLPLGSVKTHVRRGLQRLREALTSHDS
jgi:RNA polymerase sigma factor (sigma-70 family)